MSTYDHLLKAVLALEDDEVKVVKQLRMRTLSKLNHTTIAELDTYLNNPTSNLTPVTYTQLKRWLMYYKVHQPSPDDMLALTEDAWDKLDFDVLTANYNNIVSSSTPSPVASLTTGISNLTTGSASQLTFTKKEPSATTVSDVHYINFLKYTEVSLRDKDNILIFYRDIYNQGKQHNVHVTKLEDITSVENATVPSALRDLDTIKLTGDILYQKFRKSGVISDTFASAHNLLDTTTNGYDFLLLLLR